MDRKDQQHPNQSSSLHRTIDYDPLRDQHLKKFFRSPFMQEHMRHAAALDKVSSRRNPWNDAVEYLMEAGSAYTVKSLFSQDHPQAPSATTPAASSSTTTRPTSSSTSGRSHHQHHQQPLRPQPPQTSSSSSSKRRPMTSTSNNSTRRLSVAQINEKYRNVPGRTYEQQQHQQHVQSMTSSKNSSPSHRVKRNLAPLPKYSAALRNIRRFDDEVSRIIAEGKQADIDKKENDRWSRMQKRRKIENMIREASSPKFGRRYPGEGEDGDDHHKKNRNKNNNRDKHDEDHEDIETYRQHQHHSRPRSLAMNHLHHHHGSSSSSLNSHHHYNNNNQDDNGIYEDNDDDDNYYQRHAVDDDDDDDEVSRIPGWVSYALSRFQAHCIGWVVRHKLQRARDSVIKIQRTFREHLTNRGVNLALRIIQKAGRAMKVRRRLFLLGERHRIWRQASDEHGVITSLCLRLHSATAFAAKLPLLEAAYREQIEEEHQKSFEDNHFELTAGELKRRALLTCVAPKGKLRRESFRRLLDDDDEEPSGDRAQTLMKPIDTPSVLLPVMKEIEEDEPSPRGDSESPQRKPTSATEEETAEKKEKSPSPVTKEELVSQPQEEESTRRKDDENEREEARVEQEQDRREEDIRADADTTIVPANPNEVEEL